MGFVFGVEKFLRVLVQIIIVLFLLLSSVFSGYSDRTQAVITGEVAFDQGLIRNTDSPGNSFQLLEKRLMRFMKKWDIPGASVAIAQNDRLVYARGYGLADVENGEYAEPWHLFRIASISKLITAATIFHLFDSGLLTPDTRVFGPQGILDTLLFPDIVDKRVFDITVQHLLEHSAGWTTRWGDHMFMPHVIARHTETPSPPDIETIIRFSLSKRLHFKPGAYSSYSNLGYAILGKVVERVTRMDYETYVRENLMAPLGILDFYIGNNTLEGRLLREVRYYETEDADKIPALDGSGELVSRSDGGNDIATLGAAGGWVASSSGLVKFMLAIDGIDTRPDILSLPSVQQMMTGYGLFGPLGWRAADGAGNCWRTGSFAGSSAVVEMRADGITWAVLMNASAWKGADFPFLIRQEMHAALRTIDQWPGYDLFVNQEKPLLKPNIAFP